MKEPTHTVNPTEELASDANVDLELVVRQKRRRSEIIKYIDALRLTDPYIRTIFTNGGCYRFALFLRHSYPDGKPITNFNFDHVRLLIDGRGYDIYGDVDFEPHNWHVMSEQEIAFAEKWSFAKQRMVQIGECPACDEPLVA